MNSRDKHGRGQILLIRLLVFLYLLALAAVGVAYLLGRYERRIRPLHGEERMGETVGDGALGRLLAEAFFLALAFLSWPFKWLESLRSPASGGLNAQPVLFLSAMPAHEGVFFWLKRSLFRAGFVNLYSFSLPLRVLGEEGPATTLADRVAMVRRETGGGPLDVVAFGGAGIAAARTALSENEPPLFRKLIALGCPWSGTRLAALGPASYFKSLAPGAPGLEGLGKDPRDTDRLEIVSIFSRDDDFVIPAENARLAGARNIELEGLGHATLLFSRRVAGLVREELLR